MKQTALPIRPFGVFVKPNTKIYRFGVTLLLALFFLRLTNVYTSDSEYDLTKKQNERETKMEKKRNL